MKRFLLLVCALSIVLPVTAWAQGGGIEGNVLRADGSGVGGVAVVVNETGDAELTGSDGSFEFPGVAPGTYSLSFTLGDNFASEEGVEVEAGSPTTVEKTVDWQVSFAETITVVSASRRAERIVEAPAAVSLVTDAEIAREAAHAQLPKLLEFTPGAEVTQSGLYDYNLNTRGFNSSLNRRVATLVDGRDPSVPFLGAQEWAALSFPLDDIASLEMVRGPSAALYGANASSGIVNLITKRPKDSQGGSLRVAAGEVSTTNLDFRWAGGLGGDWYAKLLGGVRQSGDFTVSRNGHAEYSVPCTASGQTDCLPQEAAPLNPEDDVDINFYGLRLDKHLANGHLLTFEGGNSAAEGPIFQTGIGRVQLVDIERPWYRANYNTMHWNFLFYESSRDASRQTALSSGSNVVLDTSRQTFEAQTNWSFAQDKARVVVGASFSEDDIDTAGTNGLQTLIFQPLTNDKSAFFAQLDWNATDKLKVVLAGRTDENDLHDTQFSPKASVVYSINPNSTLRLTYNEAFQVPNYSEFFLQANVAPPLALQPFEAFCTPFGVNCGFGGGPTRIIASGNAALDLEETQTTEIGYSGILGGKAYLTIDFYQSDNTNFITDLIPQFTALGRTNPAFGPYAPPANLPAPVAAALVAALQGALGPSYAILTNNFDGDPVLLAVSYTNFGDVDTQGVDVGLNYYVDDRWTVSASLSNFDFDVNSSQPGFENLLLPNTPETKGSFGVAYTAPKWDLAVDARWVDTFRWAVGPFVGDVKSYTTMDLNTNYMVNDKVRLGLSVANLLDDEHWESFGGDILSRRALGSVAFSW